MARKLTPHDVAERAVAVAVDLLTDLVTVILEPYTIEPDDLFELTFARVGIAADQMEAFRRMLIRELREYPAIRRDLEAMTLSEGVQIGLVVEYVARLLTQAQNE